MEEVINVTVFFPHICNYITFNWVNWLWWVFFIESWCFQFQFGLVLEVEFFANFFFDLFTKKMLKALKESFTRKTHPARASEETMSRFVGVCPLGGGRRESRVREPARERVRSRGRQCVRGRSHWAARARGAGGAGGAGDGPPRAAWPPRPPRVAPTQALTARLAQRRTGLFTPPEIYVM